jgi:transcriptional regulator with XRE-family HTH domain
MSRMLVEKRHSLAPEMVGMRCEGARRMHGLSRRDVAQIADISFNHYQRLEQGTSVGVSAPVMARICDALLMEGDEKARMLALHQAWARPRHPLTGSRAPGSRAAGSQATGEISGRQRSSSAGV